MGSIKTNAEPYVKVSHPKYIQMYSILEEQLEQIENYSDIGFQESLIWVAWGASIGALAGTIVFLVGYFSVIELDMSEKVSGLAETIIFALGIGVGLALIVPYRNRKRILKEVVSKIRNQGSVYLI